MPSDHDARPPAAGAPQFRAASAADVDAIARLHADSWRRHYRGAYLDSFLDGDVVTDRHGVGTRLLVEAARELERRQTHGGMYLWVLDRNKAAQAFYAARGGVRVEATVRGPFPGGGTAREHRIAWTNPTLLLAQQAWRGRGRAGRRTASRIHRRTS